MAATWSDLGTRSRRAVNAVSESAPTLTADGVNLADVTAVIPILHAPNGQTFDGLGTLLAYVYLNAAWVRYPRGDYDMSEASGLQDATLPAKGLPPRGLFAWVPSSVGISGGSTVTIDYICVGQWNIGGAV